MRTWLAAFTIRGTSFLAAGFAAAVTGLFLGERDLVSVGLLLLVLPLFSALAAGRARYRLSCVRSISPPRVAAGQTAQARLRLENVSRLPTGLLLAEDVVPYALGTRPRYVLNGIERGGSRELSYPLRSDLRGRFVVGPLEIRIADAFGLVELGRSFSTSTTDRPSSAARSCRARSSSTARRARSSAGPVIACRGGASAQTPSSRIRFAQNGWSVPTGQLTWGRLPPPCWDCNPWEMSVAASVRLSVRGDEGERPTKLTITAMTASAPRAMIPGPR